MLIHRLQSFTAPLLFGAGAVGSILAITVLFNSSVISCRLYELDRALEEAARAKKQNRNLGMLIRYELIRERIAKTGEDDVDYLTEAELQGLINPGRDGRGTFGTFLQPVAFPAIRAIRYLIGKEIVPNTFDRPANINLEFAYYYERKRQFGKAIEKYERALETEKDLRKEILLHLGFCYSMINEFDRARHFFAVTYELYPGSEEAAIAAKLYGRLDIIANALTHVRANAGKSGDPFERARGFYRSLRYRDALNILSDLAYSRPEHPHIEEIWFLAGRCCEELGEDSLALNCYTTLAGNFPPGPWTKNANQRILMVSSFYQKDSLIAENAKKDLADKFLDRSFVGEISEIKSDAAFLPPPPVLTVPSPAPSSGRPDMQAFKKLIFDELPPHEIVHDSTFYHAVQLLTNAFETGNSLGIPTRSSPEQAAREQTCLLNLAHENNLRQQKQRNREETQKELRAVFTGQKREKERRESSGLPYTARTRETERREREHAQRLQALPQTQLEERELHAKEQRRKLAETFRIARAQPEQDRSALIRREKMIREQRKLQQQRRGEELTRTREQIRQWRKEPAEIAREEQAVSPKTGKQQEELVSRQRHDELRAHRTRIRNELSSKRDEKSVSRIIATSISSLMIRLMKQYPAEARELQAALRLHIHADGSIRSITFAGNNNLDPGLKNLIIEELSKFTFEPVPGIDTVTVTPYLLQIAVPEVEDWKTPEDLSRASAETREPEEMRIAPVYRPGAFPHDTTADGAASSEKTQRRRH